jgi:hypothetical protein
MPHPFFDVARYPWGRTDAQALHRSLYENARDFNRIDLLYRQEGCRVPLTQGRPPDTAWAEVLDNLSTAGLLKSFCQRVMANAALAAVHDAVRAVLDVPDTTEQVFLEGQVVFLDRKRLRLELTKLGQQTGYGVLLVRGPSGSGKSWTQRLVTMVAADGGASSIYLFEGIVSTVDEVVEQLFALLGNSDAVPPRLGTEDAWFRKVCLKLQELAQARKEVLWVIADDLGDYPEGPRLDNAIRRFFEQFGLTMANPAFARWFRLVLLDYPDGAVPTKWKNFWCEDRPDENDVDHAVIKDFLMKWATIRQKNLGAEKAAELAAEILTKAGSPTAPAGMRRLDLIHSELNGVLERL